MFGAANQNKPGFGGFGATSQPSTFGTAGGSFGFGGQTNTSGSLFNANNNTQNKPLFGGTTGFGTGQQTEYEFIINRFFSMTLYDQF